MLKRAIYYIIGLVLITFGVTSVITSDLGAGPWDAFFVALSENFGLTTGTWLIIICATVMILNAVLLRKSPDFPAFITVFGQGLLVDFWLLIVFANIELTDIVLQGGMFAVGFIAIVIGVVIYLQADFAPNPVDHLMLALNVRFGIAVGTARLAYDVLVLIIAWLMGGPIFIATFILAFGSGPVIQFTRVKTQLFFEPKSNAETVIAKK